jgi:hypothetical protein
MVDFPIDESKKGFYLEKIKIAMEKQGTGKISNFDN